MKPLLFACLIGLAASAFAAMVEVPDEVDSYCQTFGCTIVSNAELSVLRAKAAAAANCNNTSRSF